MISSPPTRREREAVSARLSFCSPTTLLATAADRPDVERRTRREAELQIDWRTLGTIRLDRPTVVLMTVFFLLDAAGFAFLVDQRMTNDRLPPLLLVCCFVTFMMGSLVLISAIASRRHAPAQSREASPRKLKTPAQFSAFLRDAVLELPPQGMTVGLLWVRIDCAGTIAAELRAEAGKRLLAAFRQEDCIACLGQAEFVIAVNRLAGRSVLPGLKKRAARVLKGLALTALPSAPLTAVVGSSMYPVDGYIETDLIRAARTDAELRGAIAVVAAPAERAA